MYAEKHSKEGVCELYRRKKFRFAGRLARCAGNDYSSLLLSGAIRCRGAQFWKNEKSKKYGVRHPVRFKVCRYTDDLHYFFATQSNWTRVEEWIDYASDVRFWESKEEDYVAGNAAPDSTIGQWLFRQQLLANAA